MQMLMLMAALAAGGPADDPGAFVDGLYAYYARADPGPRDDADVFTPEIVALFAREAALAAPDEVARDGDEICQYQDWENLHLVSREVRPVGEDRAEADVRFENFGAAHEAHFTLARTAQGWRVADIADVYEGQSLVTYLETGIAQAEQASRH